MIVIKVLIGVLSVIAAYFALYKFQIRDLDKQIRFITKQETNLKLNTQILSVKDLNRLASSMNTLMEKQRKLEIELERTNRKFKETITNVSHDLRTPLTSANGYIQLLNSPDTKEEKKKEYAHVIEERIDSVKEMLDQLFEYARIEAQEYTLEKEKINVTTILTDTISEFYEDFIQKGIEPELQITNEMLYIQGDTRALKRIFQNMIRNAVVHGEGNLKISLEEKNKKIYLMFVNITKTIEEKEVENIFDRFYTTDKSRTKKTTGLGLSIAKNFVVQMGGTIEAKLIKQEFAVVIEFEKIVPDNHK